MKRDVVIIGAGAAGLMSAVEAGKRKRTVLVLEHGETPGRKIRISGGGRCNFTNTNLSSENYLSQNPHFCKSALSRFTPGDIVRMLERHGLGYREKVEGQLFCRQNSERIIDMLQKECYDAGVEIYLKCRVRAVKKNDLFTVTTNRGSIFADSLIVASGGLSYPNLGATDLGYRIARQFGLRVTALRPALVPFTFSRRDLNVFSGLSGVSVNAVVGCSQKQFRGMILFTHRGLSGPSSLQLSSYWREGDAITINLLPDMNAYDLFMERRSSRTEMKNLLSEYLPKSFARRWSALNINSKPLNQYSDRDLKMIAHLLHEWEIIPEGTEGYRKAEVTLGGIDTVEISSKTMESRNIRGLYFVGEVLDVTGQLGGYNLHWAWASGYVAGQYA